MTSTPKSSRPNMPGYGLLPADEGSGLKPWSYATERLTRARGYWIATVCPDGRPHAMPIWGVWLREQFCFSTGATSRKAKNIARDPRVTINVEPADDAIVLEGTAALVHDAAFKAEFVRAYSAKYAYDMEGFDEPIYGVQPRRVFSFASAAAEFVGGSTRWTFS